MDGWKWWACLFMYYWLRSLDNGIEPFLSILTDQWILHVKKVNFWEIIYNGQNKFKICQGVGIFFFKGQIFVYITKIQQNAQISHRF